jgi:hypothetical protein
MYHVTSRNRRSLHVIESFVLDLVGCAGRWRVVCASVWLVV